MTVSKDNEYVITLEEINCAGDRKKIPKGSILKIQSMDDFGIFKFSNYGNSSDWDTIYESSSILDIAIISTNIFKFVIAIRHPNDRIDFVKSTEKQNFILKLKENDPVKIPQAAFSSTSNGKLRRAFVKYVGLVQDIGPGFHFIVSLMVIFFSYILM